MFVDKKLKGVKAVQTLSRLNRTCPGKHDTLIIDFANTDEEIRDAFQPFYEETTLDKAVDVNLIYDTQSKLRSYMLYDDETVQKFMEVYRKSGKEQSDADLGIITGILKPVTAEFSRLSDDKRFMFKKAVRNFCKWYSYITTITRMFDHDLEEEYVFCQYLDKLLPGIHDPDMENIEDKLKLKYYKLKQTFDGDIGLAESSDDSQLKTPESVDVKPREKNDKELNEILESINSQYNGIFTEDDQVVTTTLFVKAKAEKELKEYAKNNDRQVYVRSIFPEFFERIAMECYMSQMGAFKKLFENKDMYNAIMNAIASESFREFNRGDTDAG
jgi:type I restriction enzyme R subunit